MQHNPGYGSMLVLWISAGISLATVLRVLRQPAYQVEDSSATSNSVTN